MTAGPLTPEAASDIPESTAGATVELYCFNIDVLEDDDFGLDTHNEEEDPDGPESILSDETPIPRRLLRRTMKDKTNEELLAIITSEELPQHDNTPATVPQQYARREDLEDFFPGPLLTMIDLEETEPPTYKNSDIQVSLNQRRVPHPFPIPFTDLLLDEVAGCDMYNFMDGFNGYNQIVIAPEDQLKTMFVTQWGTFAYREFTFTVEYKPGKSHSNADFLSRLPGAPSKGAIDTYTTDHHLFLVISQSSWRIQLKHYLTTGNVPRDLHPSKAKAFQLNALPFTLIGGQLFRMGADHVLRRCLTHEEIPIVLRACHTDEAGGHFSSELTTRKIYLTGYWWPSVHKDAEQYCKRCDTCQRQGRPKSWYTALLSPLFAGRPFQKWGIDYIGEIHPPTRQTGHQYIIVATDYVTKWAEARSFPRATGASIIQFLQENIISRFGVPLTIITDNGTHFLNDAMTEITRAYDIQHKFSTPYHP
ncbi:hypothetical protein R1sor_009247 [Riccia sorocarpa]|uniref:Integrase catalytic domain-containing protein n=1 Tax=Riccia sorocarpa TaxID=122646 RepID=A0ABD3H571_9MARC